MENLECAWDSGGRVEGVSARWGITQASGYKYTVGGAARSPPHPVTQDLGNDIATLVAVQTARLGGTKLHGPTTLGVSNRLAVSSPNDARAAGEVMRGVDRFKIPVRFEL